MTALAIIFFLLTFICALLAIVGLIYPKPFRNRKTGAVPSRLKMFGGFLGASFLCLILTGITAPETEEQKQAKVQAVAQAEADKKARAEKRAAEKKAEAEKQAQAEAEKKAEAERLARAAAEKEANCRNELQCWGEKHISAASVYCANQIERLAQYSHEWTDGFFESKMSRFKWLDKKAGTLTYFGDKMKFQNGFGAWQHHIYQCDFDPAGNAVLFVSAMPGRL